MNTQDYYLAMFRYHLHQPLRTWLLILFMTSQTVFLGWIFNWTMGEREISGFGELNYLPGLFSFIAMLTFVGGSVQLYGSGRAWIISNGEFLLSRPLPRRPVFLTLLVICALILLLCPVINLLWTLPRPEMLVSLYPGTQAAHDLPSYQAAFPSATIVHLRGHHYDTLRIPFGSTYEALWALWLTILTGLAAEALTLGSVLLAELSVISRARVFAAICCLPAAILLGWRYIGPHVPIDQSFFLFATHPVVIPLLTLMLFALIQVAALKRMANVEVT